MIEGIGDYILITNELDDKYLQIGEVIDIEYYDNSNDVKTYTIRFGDKKVVKYDYKLVADYECKVLRFKS